MNLILLNNFYKKQICKNIVFKLYKNKCQKCGEIIDSEGDVSHVFPQSEKERFKEIFPNLDVHNLINLVPMHRRCNRSSGNSFIDNELLITNTLNYTEAIVSRRLKKIMSKPYIAATDKRNENIKDYLFNIINFNRKYKRWTVLKEDEALDIDFCEKYNLDYEDHPIFNIEEHLKITIRKYSIADLMIKSPKTFHINTFKHYENLQLLIKTRDLIKIYRDL